MGRAWVGQRFRAVGLWLSLDTLPAKEPQNGENDIRILLGVRWDTIVKVIGMALSW